VELCRVEGKMVGVPAAPAPWHLAPADGLLAEPPRGRVQLLHQGFDEPRLLVAGCDPATPLLARRLERASVGLVTAVVNSSAALDLLKRRLVHVAGTHLKDEASGDANRAAVRARFPRRGVAVFTFAAWEEGLVLARGNPKKIGGVADLARAGVRLANREKGSGSRQLLDSELKKAGVAARAVTGYGEAPPAGHLAAAWRVYTGLADACVATRSAARAFGLDFVPLASERYDLVMREEHLELASVGRLLDTLTQAAFRHELDALCGYDTRETGRRVV
jgi:molybdate-binding protein